MPTYDYKCDSCGHQFEAFQGIKDEPLLECPNCLAKPRRLIGKGAGIIFKGAGFYATDYRNKTYSTDAKKEEVSKSSSDSSKSTSDTKTGNETNSDK